MVLSLFCIFSVKLSSCSRLFERFQWNSSFFTVLYFQKLSCDGLVARCDVTAAAGAGSAVDPGHWGAAEPGFLGNFVSSLSLLLHRCNETLSPDVTEIHE